MKNIIPKKRKFRRFKSKFEVKGEITLRDFLAMERTTLANERTFFAYIRTAFYLILAGIAFVQLEGFQPMRWVGYTLFAISSGLFIFGIVRYQLLQKKLNRYYKSMDKKVEDVIGKDTSEE